ncbi:unnamed protein product [Oppiella nova]|uniref:Neural proliferation differentiation and control protein 1 n=1 Tax=Oppiella nova TaxID=334625 RepID=A0A7R9QI45_9ACAR|nr:unnamed protein product [Oppiella nova]CAG2165797.1 unnamed protein product [Oppiella nova]
MRTVSLLLFLIIAFLCRFGRSQPHSNLAKTDNKPQIGDSGKPTVGEREYYIPSYNSPQLVQRPQEFIYPNNARNSYQIKYTNNRPEIVNRLWPTARQQTISYNNALNGRQTYDTSADSVDSRVVDDYQHKRPAKYNLGPNDDKHDTNRQKSTLFKTTAFRTTDRVRDVSAEQQRLSRPLTATDEEYKDVLNDIEFSPPVMRRKSATNENLMQTSALQSGHRNAVPIPLAIQQNANSLNDDSNGSLGDIYFVAIQQNANSLNDDSNGSLGDIYFVAIVACVSAVAIFGVIGAGICVYKVQQSNKAAADVDYPAYGVVGPVSKEGQPGSGQLSPSGDRKLAQSAQMYHYHHQKQQMIASEKAVTTRRNSASDVESDEENEEGEYTVYECPGLAPTGEMEVKNPLFHDDITPVSSPPVTGNTKDK